MAQKKDKRFEGLAALELTKDIGVGGAEFLGVDIVEDGAHLGIGRDVLNAEERFEVGLIVSAFIVKGQEGRSFESEDGKTRHEGIPDRNLRCSGARIGNHTESGSARADRERPRTDVGVPSRPIPWQVPLPAPIWRSWGTIMAETITNGQSSRSWKSRGFTTGRDLLVKYRSLGEPIFLPNLHTMKNDLRP